MEFPWTCTPPYPDEAVVTADDLISLKDFFFVFFVCSLATEAEEGAEEGAEEEIADEDEDEDEDKDLELPNFSFKILDNVRPDEGTGSGTCE